MTFHYLCASKWDDGAAWVWVVRLLEKRIGEEGGDGVVAGSGGRSTSSLRCKQGLWL